MPRAKGARKQRPPLAIPSKLDPPKGNGLTPKEAVFVYHWFTDARCNPTEAARLCGYAQPQAEGFRLIRRPEVRDAIAAQLDQYAMGIEELLMRTTDIARFDPMTCCDNVNGRLTFNAAKAVRNGMTHMIRAITPTAHGVKVEFHDAMAAQGRLFQFHGLSQPQRIQVEGEVTHKGEVDVHVSYRVDIKRLSRTQEGLALLEKFSDEQIGLDEFIREARALVPPEPVTLEGTGLQEVASPEPSPPDGPSGEAGPERS
jgi:hypothetical protein